MHRKVERDECYSLLFGDRLKIHSQFFTDSPRSDRLSRLEILSQILLYA